MGKTVQVSSFCALVWLLVVPAVVQAEAVTCEISENGKTAFGTFVVLQDGKEVGGGQCGEDSIKVAPGKYLAIVKLDGSLDGPEQRKDLAVSAGKPARVKADFATGTLKVTIKREGRRAAGVAIVRRGDVQVGTLGSGVGAHLSAGTYEVVVRYRDEERVFEAVAVEAGKTRTLDASF